MSNINDTFVDPSPSDDSDNKEGGLRRGFILGGNLEMLKPLGRGGMGEVWLANELDKSQKFVRQVVVKIVPRDVQNASEEMERVQESFHTVQALQHAHVCPLYRMDKDDEYGYFIVMKYIAGPNLSTYVRDYKKTTGQQPSLKGLLSILKEIAEALDYAHGKGVIHRDIKPQNILISPEDGAQLIDFGLAATIRTSVMNVSNVTGPVSGTMFYMAPEQLRGRHQDARTDQYAFAATVYELLGGRPPFESDDRNILRTCILEEPVEPLPGAPEHLNRALIRALSKDKTLRFQSCIEFVQALEGMGDSSRELFSGAQTPSITPPPLPPISSASLDNQQPPQGFVDKITETVKTGCGCLIIAFVALIFMRGCSCILFPSSKSSSNHSGGQSYSSNSPAPMVPQGPTPEDIERMKNEYVEMLAHGKKYTVDWTYKDQAVRFGLVFESHDPDSGKITGILFDPKEPDKKRNFTGMFDQSLQSKPPITIVTDKATFSQKEGATPTQKIILSNYDTWTAHLLKDGNMFVEAPKGQVAKNPWRLVPLSDESYQQMITSFESVEKERTDQIKSLVQAGKCYVANWTLKGFSGRLGILVEKFDDTRGTFTGIIFDANEIDRKKKFNGTINLSRGAWPYLVQLQGDSGMKRTDGKNKTTDLFLVQGGRNYDWNFRIVDGKPSYEGYADGYGIYGDVKLFFEDADYPKMLEKFEVEEKARIDEIKNTVQKGKTYITEWNLKGFSGKIGMTMTGVDEQKQTFEGYLFSVHDRNLKKRFTGNISFDRFANFPYVLRTKEIDGSPRSGGQDRTLDLFFVKGHTYEWNLRIVDGQLIYDGYQDGYGIYGDIELKFGEK